MEWVVKSFVTYFGDSLFRPVFPFLGFGSRSASLNAHISGSNKLPMGIYVVRSKLVDDSHTFELFVKGFNSSSFPFIYVDTGGKKNHLQAKLQRE